LNYIRANYFIPDARRYWIKPSVRFLKEYLRDHPVDWIISTGPPHSVHIIARNLKRKLGVRWLADFRDPWTDIDYFHRLPLTPVSYARHRKLESTVLSEANILTVVSKQMQQKYLPYNKRCHVVPNGFEGEIKSPQVYKGRFFTLTHIGMLNADRNHEMFWEVLSEMLENYPNLSHHLRIRLIGKVAEEAKRSARRHGMMRYVEIVDYIPYDEIEKVQQDSAVLLLFVNRVPGAKGIVTGKVFEYLRSGKPILAIGPAGGDLAEIIAGTHSGVVVDFDRKEDLKRELDRLYNAFRQGNLKAGTREAEMYSRKKLTEALSRLLKNYTAK
jgi:glycosyltransferase involved in cell wall biosynthesis